jgi:hypothetical protein
VGTKGEKRICPITSKELGAHTKAVYIVPCGHAFSEAAIKEVADDTCLQCSESYDTENIIPVLPLAKEDIAQLAERKQRLKDQGLTHSLKKAPGGKKRKKDTVTRSVDTTRAAIDADRAGTPATGKAKKVSTNNEADVLTKNSSASAPQSKSGTATPLGGIKNAATASLTARVLDEQEEKNKRRKLGLNDNLKSLFSKTGSNGSTQKGDDFMTRGYSIPREA